MADRHRLEGILILARMAASPLLVFYDRYLVTNLKHLLAKIRAHIKSLGEGDLTREPEDLGHNCVGQLVSFVKQMQRNLQDAVQTIRDNGVILHREAGNIEVGNADLSDRTSTQAAALEQTAASMEEIMVTVSHYAENARELAGRTGITHRGLS